MTIILTIVSISARAADINLFILCFRFIIKQKADLSFVICGGVGLIVCFAAFYKFHRAECLMMIRLKIIILAAIMSIIFFSESDQLISLKIPTSRALNVAIPSDTNE